MVGSRADEMRGEADAGRRHGGGSGGRGRLRGGGILAPRNSCLPMHLLSFSFPLRSPSLPVASLFLLPTFPLSVLPRSPLVELSWRRVPPSHYLVSVSRLPFPPWGEFVYRRVARARIGVGGRGERGEGRGEEGQSVAVGR